MQLSKQGSQLRPRWPVVGSQHGYSWPDRGESSVGREYRNAVQWLNPEAACSGLGDDLQPASQECCIGPKGVYLHDNSGAGIEPCARPIGLRSALTLVGQLRDDSVRRRFTAMVTRHCSHEVGYPSRDHCLDLAHLE